MTAIGSRWRHELLRVSSAIMETCWTAPWLLLAMYAFAPRHPPLPLAIGIFLGIYLVSWLVRALDSVGLGQGIVSIIAATMALLSAVGFLRVHFYGGRAALDTGWMVEALTHLGRFLEFIPMEAIAMLAVFFLWWRGMGLGNREYTLGQAGFSFRAGIVLLMWNAALAALLGRSIPILGFAFVFFFFGLLSIGLARVTEIEQQPESGGQVSTGFWLGATLGGIISVLGLALATTQLVTVGNVRVLLQWLRPLWRLLEGAATVLAYLIGLILQPLLDWLIRTFRSRIDFDSLFSTPAPDATPQPAPPLLVAPPPAYLEVIKYVIIGLFFLGILALVAFSFRRARARALARSREEEREIEWEWSLPGKGIMSGVRAGFDRLAEALRLASQFGLGQRFRAAVSIRWIYANLLRLAAEQGLSRQIWQTPYEFLPALERTFVGFEPDLRAITDAYVRTHYGELPETPEELRQVVAAWENIRGGAEKP